MKQVLKLLFLGVFALHGQAFPFYDVVIKTCNKKGAGTDANAFIKVYYESFHHQDTFTLETESHNDLERNQLDHYRIRLSYPDPINVGLFYRSTAFALIGQQWCVDWLVLLNGAEDKCYGALFGRWIGRYRNPPTYARQFRRMRFADCVFPGNRSFYERQQWLRTE